VDRDKLGPADPRIAYGQVLVVVSEENYPLELGEFAKDLEGRRTDILIALGVFVAPSGVDETDERDGETDECDDIVSQLLAEVAHWRVPLSLTADL
jgi:hypothetical protein